MENQASRPPEEQEQSVSHVVLLTEDLKSNVSSLKNCRKISQRSRNAVDTNELRENKTVRSLLDHSAMVEQVSGPKQGL